MAPKPVLRGWLRGFAIGVAAACGAYVVRLALDPVLGDQAPLLLFFLGVAVAAGIGGLRAGLVATVAGLGIGLVAFIEPAGLSLPDSDAELTRILIFLLGGMLASFLIGSRLAALDEALEVRRALEAEIAERDATERRLGVAEATLNAVLDALPAGAIFADASGRLVRWNRANEDLWGLHGVEPGETAGVEQYRDWKGWWYPGGARLGPHDWAMARALEKHEHVKGDLVEIERFDGTGRRVIINMGAPVFDRNGALTGAVVVQTDITERVRAEAIVRERERHLRQVLDAMYAFVAVLDAQGTLVEVNQSPLKVAGLTRDEVIGRPFWDCPWWGHDTAARERLRAAFARASTGEVVRYDETACVAGGRIIVVDFMLQPVIEDGQLRFVIPSGVDVTERRRAEEQLREADRRKDEFLATLSHELRNPLSPIRNAARLLGSPQLTPEGLAWGRQVIERQVRHMGRLLDDLLDVARITEGKLELKYERVAFNTVVDAAVEAAQPLLEAKRHTLNVHLPPLVVEVDCDPVRLAQVFANLLTNAAKYTAAGGRIDFSMQVEAGCVVASVRDDGIGIAGPALQSVFEMFSQVKGALPHSEGGLGVGLALARGIVELHGGSIQARSEGAGRGAEFTVRLPFATVGRPAAAPPQAGASHGPGRRIMVADDNEDAAQSLAMLLRGAGHEVVVANDGVEAVDLATRQRPDLAILDIGMPRLDGYEVAARLRQLPGGDGIGLVALTGWGQEHDKRRAATAGFDLHVTKPLDPDTLDQLVAVRPRESSGEA